MQHPLRTLGIRWRGGWKSNGLAIQENKAWVYQHRIRSCKYCSSMRSQSPTSPRAVRQSHGYGMECCCKQWARNHCRLVMTRFMERSCGCGPEWSNNCCWGGEAQQSSGNETARSLDKMGASSGENNIMESGAIPVLGLDGLWCPSNLHCCYLIDTQLCSLCRRRGTIEHILSCCPSALGEGWQHDQVLKISTTEIICSYQRSKCSKQTISFIRAGEKTTSGLLKTEQLTVD